jgi:hypothetical protein
MIHNNNNTMEHQGGGNSIVGSQQQQQQGPGGGPLLLSTPPTAVPPVAPSSAPASSSSSGLPNVNGNAEGTQQFCLRWNSYPATVATQLAALRDAEDFVDVTLACDGRQLRAHKLVLSACSPYFMQLFKVIKSRCRSSPM